MGSIEAFPRKRARNLADVWRTAPLRGSGVANARASNLEDYAAIRGLQRIAQPGTPAWSLKQFESQRAAFGEGQAVAECDGEVVGAASSLVVRWSEEALGATWREITSDGYFTGHDSSGDTLYAAATFVDFSRHGFGAARVLHQARRKLCRRLNLRRIIGAIPLAGYAAVSETLSADAYAQRVIWGDIDDAALRFELAQGYQYCGVLASYLPAQHGTSEPAALMVWLNPMYAPAGPPAFATARPRKCA